MADSVLMQVIAPRDRFGRVLFRLCRGVALTGGLTLLAVAAMTVASVASRALAGHALLGDFELVQLGCAVAVASFLPYGQMRRTHVLVDFFTSGMSPRSKRRLDAVGALLLATCAAAIAWQMTIGMLEIRAAGETSMLLGVPVWAVYLMMVPSFALLSLTGLHSAWTFLGGGES
ncbi:MAG: TRAP transporter small permease [Zoogloeaceae bacterium]|nr:TRAP transporter small permease [Rhodocyclaceae bacterium]MCP5235503.1 TRAP transporter small permease [Zoogloeaceae bacterium]